MVIISNLTIKIKDKPIIENFSFEFKRNNVYFLLAKSGQGKTSFFRALTGKMKYSGTIENRNGLIGYMDQEIHLFENLTVLETISFYYSLTNREPLPPDSIKDFLKRFRLDDKMDQKIGSNLHNGLSGGEKKKLMVACFLLRNDPILLLDEPFSGLDTESQDEVFDIIINHVFKNKTLCIITIHNPTIYIEKRMNHRLSLKNRIMSYEEKYVDELHDIEIDHTEPPDDDIRFPKNRLMILMKRELLLLRKDYKEFLSKFASIVVIALLQLIVLGDISSSIQSIKNRTGPLNQMSYLMHIMIVFFTSSIFPAMFIHPFFKYLSIINNEVNQGWYDKRSIYLIKFWVEIVIVSCLAFLYCFIVWWPVKDSGLFFLFNINIWNEMIFTTMLMFILSLTQRYMLTLSSMVSYNSFSFLFNVGYMVRCKSRFTGALQLLSIIYLQTYSNLLALQEGEPNVQLLGTISIIPDMFKDYREPLLISAGYIFFMMLLYHAII